MTKDSNSVFVVFTSVGGSHHILENIANSDIRKAAADDLGHCLLDKVNEFVPVSSGKLKAKGYKLFTEDHGGTAYVNLSYRNKSGLPYVMYQYYGVVYGPNMAVFEEEKTDTKGRRKKEFYTMRRMNIQHIGWASPKGKTPRKENLGHPEKHTITLKDGREIHITGYTGNKNAEHKWLEYVRDTATIWYPLRQEMIRFIEAVYSGFVGNDKKGQMYANMQVAKWHANKIAFKKLSDTRAFNRKHPEHVFRKERNKHGYG